MSEHLPPSIDPVAAAHWQACAPTTSPWLHEEVARRMQDRLQWIRKEPTSWCDWGAVRGGLEGHALVAQRYPRAACTVFEASSRHELVAREHLSTPWWQPARWRGGSVDFGLPRDASVQMLWSNMALHMAADPQALLAQWHRALAVDGYLMFSCFGPDTVRELRGLYASMGMPPAGHEFTDMHDWGDMLVHAGFAEPVMDMERVTLTFATPERALQELRELGANLHPQRFPGLRGRSWLRSLEQAMRSGLSDPQADGQLALTFEIIYGHAFKPTPRVRVDQSSAVSLQDMREMLRRRPESR
jgi:malonyl-CoA O-methyltransferase